MRKSSSPDLLDYNVNASINYLKRDSDRYLAFLQHCFTTICNFNVKSSFILKSSTQKIIFSYLIPSSEFYYYPYLESLLTTKIFSKATILQIQGVAECYATKFCKLIGDEMGVGKTFQTLMLIKINMKLHENFKVMILAPPSLLTNWMAEAKKFICMKKSQMKKVVKPDSNWEDEENKVIIYLASSSNTGNLLKHYNIPTLTKKKTTKITEVPVQTSNIKPISIDMLIVDECHNVRIHNRK